jgi:transposase-like protein
MSARRKTTSPSKRRYPRRGRRLTPAEKAAIVAAYEAGQSYAEIQSQFGIGHNTVARLTNGCERRVRKLSSKEEQDIVSAYGHGANYGQLSDRFGVSDGTIKTVLDKFDVVRRGALARTQLRRIASEYFACMVQAELAVRLGISQAAVTRTLAHKERSRPRYMTHLRRYPIDHDAFARVNPLSAYWMGFLMADGCVYGGNSVQLTSHVRDTPHLEAFLRFVGSPDRPVRVRGQTAIATVYSPKLVADLTAHGVVPRKSYGTWASKRLARMPSFWLGVIDGDGTVGVSRAPYIALCGSRPLMKQYQRFLADVVLGGRYQQMFRRADGLCVVTMEGESARRLADALYSASPTSLERKAEKARAALGYSSLLTPDPESRDRRSGILDS